jgi:hypothetical protein
MRSVPLMMNVRVHRRESPAKTVCSLISPVWAFAKRGTAGRVRHVAHSVVWVLGRVEDVVGQLQLELAGEVLDRRDVGEDLRPARGTIRRTRCTAMRSGSSALRPLRKRQSLSEKPTSLSPRRRAWTRLRSSTARPGKHSEAVVAGAASCKGRQQTTPRGLSRGQNTTGAATVSGFSHLCADSYTVSPMRAREDLSVTAASAQG